MEMLPPVLLVGAGRMGAAMFAGWRESGLAPSAIIDPAPAAGIARPEDRAVARLADLPPGFRPEIVVLAVKPQVADAVLAEIAPILPRGALVVSVMAGRRLAGIGAALGGAPVVRTMPNLPATIGLGATVAFAGPGVTAAQRALADRLLGAVGDVAWVDDEALLDAAAAISGGAPAWVFLLAELLEQEGVRHGFPPAMAASLARRTITGAGALLQASDEPAASLRQAVTSPGGTTAEALAVLMAEDAWPALVRRAVRAARSRAEALAR